MSDTYQIDENSFQPIDGERLRNSEQVSHKPKVLLLYGSLRERSFSRLMTEEAALVLSKLGAETKTFNPTGGVISPTSTTINVNIPNQIAVSSGVIPKSNVIIKGKKTGIVKSIIAKLSIKQPKNK